MPLVAGSRLGSHEIISPLGAGGMGEVYRARDTKLGRSVAIKVLPDDVATHAERCGRCERPAHGSVDQALRSGEFVRCFQPGRKLSIDLCRILEPNLQVPAIR